MGFIEHGVLSIENKYFMKSFQICVIGLGYVGLPLARLFSTKYPTVGYDLNAERVAALNAGHDASLAVSDELLQEALHKNVLFARRILRRSGMLTFMLWQCLRQSIRITVPT